MVRVVNAHQDIVSTVSIGYRKKTLAWVAKEVTVDLLERGDKSQSEVLAVLAEYKDAGNMTEE